MTADPGISQFDWDPVSLVVFDVDGTLYDQRPLRMRIARDLLLHTLTAQTLRPLLVLRAYRRIRERLADREVGPFEAPLLAETAAHTRCSTEDVLAIVSEWIEQRPLVYLASCRFTGLNSVFDGIRKSGRTIGVLSDYPARAKLTALGLTADHTVSAGDDEVGFMKPNPRGLQTLIARAGATAASTVLIGDRVERDGAVARRLGVRALLRSRKPIPGFQTFPDYGDELFSSLSI